MVKSWLSVPAPPFPLCPASHVLDISAFDVTELSKQRHAVATDFWSESLLTYLISIKGTSAALSGWLCPRWLCIWSVNFRETDLTSVSMIVKCQWCIENFCGVWNQRVPETFKFPDPSPLGKQASKVKSFCCIEAPRKPQSHGFRSHRHLCLYCGSKTTWLCDSGWHSTFPSVS